MSYPPKTPKSRIDRVRGPSVGRVVLRMRPQSRSHQAPLLLFNRGPETECERVRRHLGHGGPLRGLGHSVHEGQKQGCTRLPERRQYGLSHLRRAGHRVRKSTSPLISVFPSDA